MIKDNKSIDGTLVSDLKQFSRKKVIKICDTCKVEIIATYADVLHSRKKRNNEIDYCKSCSKILFTGENNPSKRQEVRDKISKAHKGKGKFFLKTDGVNTNLTFRRVTSRGYIQVYDTQRGTYIEEHRYNLEKFLNKELTTHQVVHHINGNKTDNNVFNLYLCETVSEHSHIHSQLEILSFDLFNKNVIIFDKQNGRYKLNQNMLITEESIGFENISFKQKKNICKSRLDVKTNSEIFRGVNTEIPLIASNMSTVINSNFYNIIHKNGAFAFLHRALAVSDYLKEISNIKENQYRAVSIGIGNDQYELAKLLIKNGANVILIDIAHGYCDPVIELGRRLKKEYPHIKIVVGNTTNVDMMYEVDDFADAVKVGIAQGFACETKNTAGCTEKQFSCVLKFKEVSKKLGLPIISDGGTREPADVVKALAAGANSVMAGSIFASCSESAAKEQLINGVKKKLYAGMASEHVQNEWKGGLKPGTCSEGGVRYLEQSGSVNELLDRYQGAIRSGITYSGAIDIKSLQEKVEFIKLV